MNPSSILEINLAAIAANYNFLKQQLKTGTTCGAVVKADAYGLGAMYVAPVLFHQGCRDFFVTTFDEGFNLRQHLPDSANIYILHGPQGISPQESFQKKLIPVLNSLEDIEFWQSHADQSNTSLPAILHIDTGMNRLGLHQKELKALSLESLKKLNIIYIISHLACADTPDHYLNMHQLNLFKKSVSTLNQTSAKRLSLANSAGIFLGADWHFDLVRPGCALYGLNPQFGMQNPMQNVVTLKAKILQIKEIKSDQTVGYGAIYRAKTPHWAATIEIGYADGYFRHLTEHGQMFIDGIACPVIGRVSMDATIINLSALKTLPKPGDFADIICAYQSADDVAVQAGTIGYEVLTALGKRYKRIYSP